MVNLKASPPPPLKAAYKAAIAPIEEAHIEKGDKKESAPVIVAPIKIFLLPTSFKFDIPIQVFHIESADRKSLCFRKETEAMHTHMDWCQNEFSDINLQDKRLDLRFIKVANSMLSKPTASLNYACNDWASAKAAYRLMSNGKLTNERILFPHQTSTLKRLNKNKVVLAIQDTTYFNYNPSKKIPGIGNICTNVNGLIMHSTYAVLPNGLPIGLIHCDLYSRNGPIERMPGGKNIHNMHTPIEKKESHRWLKSLDEISKLNIDKIQTRIVSVCDREGDIYDLFQKSDDLKIDFLIRTSRNRYIKIGPKRRDFISMKDQLESAPIAGKIQIKIPKKEGVPSRIANLNIKFISFEMLSTHRKKF